MIDFKEAVRGFVHAPYVVLDRPPTPVERCNVDILVSQMRRAAKLGRPGYVSVYQGGEFDRR